MENEKSLHFFQELAVEVKDLILICIYFNDSAVSLIFFFWSSINHLITAHVKEALASSLERS